MSLGASPDLEDNSKFFSYDKAVYVPDGVYKVDKQTLFDIYDKKIRVVGPGALLWKDFNTKISHREGLSGITPVSLLNEDIYTSMTFPSEKDYFMQYRINGMLGYKPPSEEYNTIQGIAALYRVTDAELPDEFDVYFGKMKTFVLGTEANAQWKICQEYNYPPNIRRFTLPWTEAISYPVDQTIENDVAKIHLKKEDLESSVIHFYGNRTYIDYSKIAAIIVMCEVWIDSEELVGKIINEVGVDQKMNGSSTNIKQGFAARAQELRLTNRVTLGHDMTDSLYLSLVGTQSDPSMCWELWRREVNPTTPEVVSEVLTEKGLDKILTDVESEIPATSNLFHLEKYETTINGVKVQVENDTISMSGEYTSKVNSTFFPIGEIMFEEDTLAYFSFWNLSSGGTQIRVNANDGTAYAIGVNKDEVNQNIRTFKAGTKYTIHIKINIVEGNSYRYTNPMSFNIMLSKEKPVKYEKYETVIGNKQELSSGFKYKMDKYFVQNPETGFINVKKMGAVGDGMTDDSAFFIENVPGYVVNDGIYCVNPNVMARLNSSNCIGNGSLRLYGPSHNLTSGDTVYDPLDYIIEVKDLDNVLKKILVSGSESKFYMDRPWCTRGLKPLTGSCNAHTIGAIYKVKDAEIPDNVTIYLGKLAMFVLLKDGIWRKLAENDFPAGFGLFELPWVPETTRTLDSSKVIRHNDYIEYRLTKEDFSGLNEGKTEAVLHFWGSDGFIEERDDIVGIISAFDFWVKEPEAQDKFIAAIGVDQIDTNTKTIKQGFSGIAMNIKTYPRTQWGTTMNRVLIDNWCDFNYIQWMYNNTKSEDVARHKSFFDSTFKSSIVSLTSGDVFYRVDNDISKDSYRNYFPLNPIKHFYLPYHGSSEDVTGNFCKLFSIPIATTNDRLTFRINYFNYVNKDTPIKYLDALIEIYRSGESIRINVLSANDVSAGVVTIVKSETEISLYIKSSTWTHTIVDLEYLTYSSPYNLSNIKFDTDLLRMGAGSYNINMEKWVSINTSNCVVFESANISANEKRIGDLEKTVESLLNRIKTLEEHHVIDE